jgi:transcriptional regulator with XRE-family HTH domain
MFARGIRVDHAKQFGRRLKLLRKAKKINQAKLAERAGIESKYLSNLETGRRSPSFEKMVALARGLDVPLSALFAFDDENDPKTLRRKIEAILRHATPQQLNQIYRHMRGVVEP